MLTAHKMMALSRMGFRFVAGDESHFVVSIDRAMAAHPFVFSNYRGVEEVDDLDSIVLPAVEVQAARQVGGWSVFPVSTTPGEDLVHYVPEIDDQAEEAIERLRDWCEGL